MENASKALIFAGSILITLMIIGVAVYIFQRGQNLNDNTASRAETAEIQSFNAQFASYETVWNQGESFSDDVSRYTATSALNTISDVISAVNLASSTNSQNNYGYSYYETRGGFVETINAVEVIIDMSTNTPENVSPYYLIEPHQKVKPNYVYGTENISSTELSANARSARISSFSSGFSSYAETNCNELLRVFNESKLVMYNNSNYTIYKYYFEGEYEISEQSGLIDSLKFTLVVDEGFDNYDL